MEKLIDLHIHTVYSDGDKTPKEIIKLAKESNIGVIAITDHDVIDGLKTITEENLEDIIVIPGVEMTARVKKGRMHILGYGINPYDEELNRKLNDRVDVRNMMLYIEYLGKLFNINLTEKEVNSIINKRGNIGRPQLAEILIERQLVQDQEEAFQKYLNPVLEACRDKKVGYTKEECIEMILEAGGIPVLAHPNSLKLNEEELKKEIKYLKSIGLQGLEVEHIHLDEQMRTLLKEIAEEESLFTTGGTDYHGKNKPNVKLGTGINNNVHVTSSDLVDYLINSNKNKIKCINK